MPDERGHSQSCRSLEGLERSPCTHTCWGSSPTSAAPSQEWHGQEDLPVQLQLSEGEAWLRSSDSPQFLIQTNSSSPLFGQPAHLRSLVGKRAPPGDN